MSKKTQSLLIIFATLVVGITLGAVGSGTWRHERRAHFEKMPHEERFFRSMKRIIRPTDSQTDTLDQILREGHDRIAKVREQFEDEMVGVMDSIHTDLLAVLSADQKERLQRHLDRAPRHIFEDRFERLADDLELTAEQRTEVEKLFKEIFEDEDRKPGDFRRPRGMHRRIRQMHQRVEKLLTDAQRRKFRELRRHDRRGFGPRGFGRRPDFDRSERPKPPE